MRTLFKALCNNDLDLPGHSVIKHMHYDSSGSDETICKILYQVAKTTTIGIMDKSGFLMVDLRPVPKHFRIRATIHQEKNDRTISFSKDDIIRFVNDINDTNPIHREAPYVVPGCMILENLWYYWNISKSALQMAIYFHAPVIAEDQVTLVEISEDAHVEGYIGDTLAFSATFFGENEDSTSLKQRSIS
ncbi:hypothetical protein [uncultured Veillonella sp.]|uniref:hypothetical protein n=1 Tax=uncultured Veillonella sp. TaxID=159268 RepID=UPI0028EF4822|nr:hypothetical protein [uncultured Veillonella sp.]